VHATLMRVTSPHMGTPEASPAVGPAFNPHSALLATLPLVALNDLLWLLYLYPIRILARVLPPWCLYAIAKLSDPIIQFDARRSKARAAPRIAQACRTTPAHARRIASQSLTNTMLRTLEGLRALARRMPCRARSRRAWPTPILNARRSAIPGERSYRIVCAAVV
jgi:hypothetical protein